MLPWTDRSGAFSPLKASVLVLAVAPAIWLAGLAWADLLGPRPYAAAIHFTGDMAIRFLILTLLVTPLRHVLRSTRVILVRRLIGLAALAYALLHVALYVADLKFDMAKVASEIVLRFYLTIGFVAVLALVAMGLTSFDSVIKRMGAEAWRRLHWLVYPTAVLGLLHFFIQTRLDVTEPVLMTGLFLILIGVRVLVWRRVGMGVVPLAAVAALASVLTAAIEVAWYATVRRVPVERLLWSQIDFDFSIRPMWWVLLAGLALTAVAAFVNRRQPSAGQPSAGQPGRARGRAREPESTPARVARSA